MNESTQHTTKIQCRLCARKIQDNPILILNHSTCRTADIIYQHYGIQVIGPDTTSSVDRYYDEYLCQECWTITDQFHQLYTIVRQNEATLLATCQQAEQTLSTARAGAPSPKMASPASNIKSEYIMIECKVELDGEAAHVEEEPYDVLSISPRSSSSMSISDADQPQSAVSPRKQPALKRSAGTGKSQSASKRAKTTTITTDEAGNIIPAAVQRKAWRKHTPEEIEQQDIRIREYFAMQCELCDTSFSVLRDAVNHYPLEHQQSGFLRCCGKKFFKRTMLLDHIQHHGDPNAFYCTICKKSYISQAALELHMHSHDPGVRKPFHCVVCGTDFVKNFQLLQHQRMKHMVCTGKSFGCDICGKFFYNKWQVSTHIQSVHIASHICDICAMPFKSKAQLEFHHKRLHSSEKRPKVQCTICGNWLMDKQNLRKHMNRHEMTQATCKLCGKVTSNQYALVAHMGFVHSDRQFPCTMCDKTFKRAIGLREHLAAHTGVDLYTCTYCPRTFKSNSNMFAHRKKAHPFEWSRDRREQRDHE